MNPFLWNQSWTAVTKEEGRRQWGQDANKTLKITHLEISWDIYFFYDDLHLTWASCAVCWESCRSRYQWTSDRGDRFPPPNQSTSVSHTRQGLMRCLKTPDGRRKVAIGLAWKKTKTKIKKQKLRVTAQKYYWIAGSLCSILTNISLKVEQNVCC